MTRKQALSYIEVAGADNDHRTFVRLYTENRIGYSVAKAAFDKGRKFAVSLEQRWTPETARRRIGGTFGT